MQVMREDKIGIVCVIADFLAVLLNQNDLSPSAHQKLKHP
jgi:hypothetical protein